MIQSGAWWLFLLGGPAAYWALPARWRPGALALGSVALLGLFLGRDLVPMLALAAVAYAVPRLRAADPAPWLRGALRAVWVGWAVLLYFVWAKYVPQLAQALVPGSGLAALAVPLGVSYFSFRLLHYAIESGRGTLAPHGPADFASWLFLAPIFTAGPIERFDHFLAHRSDGRFEARFLREGAVRIAQGLVKKFVLGALLLEAFDRLTGGGGTLGLLDRLGEVSPLTVWGALGLALVIGYLDFSAYSDIAIGSARLFGLGIMENFNWPFAARSLQEWWQRWHMTLAHWCRSYIYMSMIGLTRNPYAAILATFVTMGLWHAASPHWIAWGLWHGAGMAALAWWGQVTRRRRITAHRGALGTLAGRVATLAFVVLGGAFTLLNGQAPIGQSLRLMGRAIGLDP